MKQYANYKNGQITINNQKVDGYIMASVDDIIKAFNNNSKEILSASILYSQEKAALENFIESTN